jgi:hypothetical protein
MCCPVIIDRHIKALLLVPPATPDVYHQELWPMVPGIVISLQPMESLLLQQHGAPLKATLMGS